MKNWKESLIYFLIQQSLRAWFLIVLFLYGFTCLNHPNALKKSITDKPKFNKWNQSVESSNNEHKKQENDESEILKSKIKTYYPKNKIKPYTRIYWKV